jgi:tRNA isopentenyl-2-thiomethyl-A-37 hydroxylase MiaE
MEPTALQQYCRSEQIHMESVLTLINRYGLTSRLPLRQVSSPIRTCKRYTSLTQKGSFSLTDALMVGGAIEELDIADLQSRLSTITHVDIQQVFNNLLLGSYNHLQAFANTYETETGKTYVPQTLTPEAFQTAIETTRGMYGTQGVQGARGMGRGGFGIH